MSLQVASAEMERADVDWEAVYRHGPVEQVPWFYPKFDPDMAWAFQLLDIRVPTILDLGTGPGTQAIELARRGFDVTGTDISATAVAAAQRRAAAVGVPCRFFQDDLLHTRLDRAFDLVIDRGCLHVFAPRERPQYVAAVALLVRPGGHLLLKCFGADAPGGAGGAPPPYCFAPAEVVDLFGGSPLHVCDIRYARYEAQMQPPPRALFCVLRKS